MIPSPLFSTDIDTYEIEMSNSPNVSGAKNAKTTPSTGGTRAETLIWFPNLISGEESSLNRAGQSGSHDIAAS